MKWPKADEKSAENEPYFDEMSQLLFENMTVFLPYISTCHYRNKKNDKKSSTVKIGCSTLDGDAVKSKTPFAYLSYLNL